MAATKKAVQKILFAHSAGPQYGKGKGSYDLARWLQAQLAGEYAVLFPVIEKPNAPSYQKYKNLFAAAFHKINEPIILIGHSLGASTLLKYLNEEKPDVLITAMFLISTPQWGNDMKQFALKPNFQAALPGIPAVFLYHSRHDTIVPFKHLAYYANAFPAAVVRALPGKEHVFSHGLPALARDIKSL